MKKLEKQTDVPTFELCISDFWSKYSEFAKERELQKYKFLCKCQVSWEL